MEFDKKIIDPLEISLLNEFTDRLLSIYRENFNFSYDDFVRFAHWYRDDSVSKTRRIYFLIGGDPLVDSVMLLSELKLVVV